MKLAIISGTTAPGGGPRHIYSLLENIDRNQWDVAVCTRKDGSYWDKFVALGITPYDLVLRRISISTFFQLLKILREEKPDLIHTHGKGPGLYGRLIGRLLGIPVIHTFHGFQYRFLPILNRIFYLFVENFLTLLTRHHIFVGHGEKGKAGALKFLNDSNSSVINNGIDLDSIENLAPATEAFAALGLRDSEEVKIFATLSRLSPEKGLMTLLEGFFEARKIVPAIRLILIGDCPDEHEKYIKTIEQFIEFNGLNEWVKILGPREDALELLKCVDFYISPSQSEGLPYNLLEALGVRKPVIATDIPGNNDIIRKSVEGILVPSNSAKSLAHGILNMLELGAAERQAMEQNGIARLRDQFSLERMTEKTFALYKKVLEESNAG
ncbi:MAG: glycosyltransferase family 4 protein [Nitrospinae bacterium]|nr:glycosyltransferase family 4 protein [Nitrospinota bacterium]MZH13844.1 glycosyltransferase family 4 protein [Nitrospinota bacterium]